MWNATSPIGARSKTNNVKPKNKISCLLLHYTIEKYGNLKTLVEEYNETIDSAGYPELEYDIRKQVVDMNNEISEHKVMRKSIWKGSWYSKEIGALPKLSVKRKTKK